MAPLSMRPCGRSPAASVASRALVQSRSQVAVSPPMLRLSSILPTLWAGPCVSTYPGHARRSVGGAMQQLVLERALLRDGWAENVLVEFQDGVITGVEPQAGVLVGVPQQPGVTLPGLINLHSHAFQRGMAGLAERAASDDDSFWTWREVMYRFLERLTPEDVEAIAA